MDTIIQSNQYEDGQLYQINICHLYLQVISLSDICKGDGIQVTTQTIKGKKDNTRVSKWKWLDIPPPPPTFWKIWRKALSKQFLMDGSRYLKEKLGKWNGEPNQKWRWFIDREHDNICEKEDEQYIRYSKCGLNTRHKQNYYYKEKIQSIDSILHRTTVSYINSTTIISHGSAPNIKKK